jgi:hypothetical protein
MALPSEDEESDPAFVHHGSDELPMVEVEGVRARLIAGEAFGAHSPLKTSSQTLYADIHLAAGARVPIDQSYEERALYTIAGDIEVAGDTFGPGQLLVLRPGDPIVVRAKADAQFMLFGGPPWRGRATSGGTSSPHGPSGSSRRRRNGHGDDSTLCRATRKSSSRCPKATGSPGARRAGFSILRARNARTRA